MRWILLGSLLLLSLPAAAPAYSVLTHEAIIDSAWPHELRPLLLKRFPNATDQQLRDAHAYLYGGAIIQDMGYYPFGSHFFSDLVHYTRSGDFVIALLKDAEASGDMNDYAFALGALAHYTADNLGHPIAINRTVPMVYPKLRREYGRTVTYEDNPADHLKTEFGFDVIQVARGQYADEAYHDFIGFKVAKPLLERAFQETYGLPLTDIFGDLDLALGTYRFSVSQAIPELTKAAWATKRKEIRRLRAGMTRRRYIYHISVHQYQRNWDHQYKRPGFGARFIAFLFRIMPKIGPFRAFAFKIPPPAAEKLFVASFDDTVHRYRQLIAQAAAGTLKLPNENFDTGRPPRYGDYHLADKTYAKLVAQLNHDKIPISPALQASINAFYTRISSPPPSLPLKAAAQLRSASPSPAPIESKPSRITPVPAQ